MKRLLAILLLVVVILCPVPGAMAQDTSAKGFVENLLESMLAAEGRSLSVENVSISITGDVTVGHVEVNDDAGAWLVIDELSLVWKPLSLFADQLEIDDISVKKVHLLRMPQSPEGSVAAPQQMQNLQAALIKHLAIDDMKIDKPVLGQDVEIKLEGSGEITAEPVRIRVDATASRLDGKKGDLGVRVDLDPKTRQFKADVTLAEEADGVISSLLALRGEPSVDLNLKAAGDFSTWQGNFSLDIDGQRTIAGTASSAPGATGQSITVDGTGAMSRLLPQSLERVFGGTSTLAASVLIANEGGTAEIAHANLSNDVLALRVSGIADWAGAGTKLQAEIVSKDPKAAITLPETGLLGEASLTGLAATMRLDGEIANPRWSVRLGWAAARSGLADLDRMSAEFEGQGLLPAAAPISFKGAITAALSQGSRNSLPAPLLGPVTASLSGTWWSDDRLQIANASLTAGSITLETSGQLKPRIGAYDLTVSARTESPETGNATLDRLLHGPVTAQGRITGGQEKWIELQDMAFTSAALAATASGAVAADTVALSLDATLPDLSLLHDGVTGTANFRARLAGPWQSLDATLQGDGDHVTLLGKTFETPALSATLKLEGTSPQGEIAFSGKLAGKPVDIRAMVATDPDGAMALRGFTATAGEARMNGELRWPAGGQPTGKLVFDAPDLSEVGPLFLSDISGALSGKIEMSGAGSAHRTTIDFKGYDVATGTLAAGHAEGSVTITSLFDQPRPAGTIALAKVRIGTQDIDMIDVTAEATSANAFRLTAAVTGRDLTANTAGDVSFADDGITLALTRLSGSVRDIAFESAAPFTIRQQGETLSVTGAVLNIGEGQVNLAGQVMPRLDAKVTMTAVPLSAFEKPAGVAGLRGSLSGDISLAGTTAAPQARYTLKASDIGLDMLGDLGLESFAATASGSLEGTVLTLSLEAGSGDIVSIAGDGTIDLAKPGRIDMKLKGRTGSKLFSDRLALSGLRAEGDIGFDLRLTGSLSKPDASGTLDLSNGIIGDTSGLYTFRDVTGRAELRDRVLRITSLTGATGRKGRASATGSLALDGDMAIDLRAKVSNGDYTDGSFVTARYDADLALTGSLAGGLLLSGEAGLRDTKITLSELPRRAVSPLDVRHAHAPPAVRRQTALLRRGTSGSSASLSLDLKLKVRDSISVSGRGLNVLLNGGLRIYGAIGDLAAQGSFRMYRGRLALPARSLDFERGSLTFDKNFDPLINFVAVSRGSDATITLTISGRASEPEITVTSVPQLPPEEAMARLIFDNSMLELSPLQIAQIASYVATLSGGKSGLLSGLESALGVDWLTVRQTETGDTEVGIAKRINDRLSLGVEQTTKSNTTRVIIDLSATKNLKLRGSVDSDQSTRLGVYYEKDY